PSALPHGGGLPALRVPGAGAAAARRTPAALAVLRPQEPLVPLGLGQHRRHLVDGRLVMPQERDEGVAMAARELREVVAERAPGLDTLIEIEVEVELPAALLEVIQPFPDPIDLVLGRPLALQ